MRGTGKGERGRVSPLPTASLLLHVQPRAKRTEIAGWHGDAVKVRVAAPPVEGAANEELLRFLAKRLVLPVAQVRLAAGSTGRRKQVEITGLDAATVLYRLGVR